MRISDWSSDVCSSDLPGGRFQQLVVGQHQSRKAAGRPLGREHVARPEQVRACSRHAVACREGVGHFLRVAYQQQHRGAASSLRQRRYPQIGEQARSEEHTSELQSLMRISYAVFCLKKKTTRKKQKLNTSIKYITTKELN